MKNRYYNILEINPNSSNDEIKKAYKKLAMKWHPDRNLNNKEYANNKFKQISEAGSIITADILRANFIEFHGKTGFGNIVFNLSYKLSNIKRYTFILSSGLI